MPIPLIATGLFSIIGGAVSKLLTEGVIKFLAYKALLITLITITVPIVAKNLFVWLYDTVMNAAMSNIDESSISAVTYQFGGFAGYLAFCLHVPDAISIILTAMSIRLILNFIPFVG